MAAYTAAQAAEALSYPGITRWDTTDASSPVVVNNTTTRCSDGRSNADFAASNRSAC